MKKTKKILSVALSIAISGSIMPVWTSNAAEAENKNADMLDFKGAVTSSNLEDFEGFEVGTTWTANADGTALTNNLSSFIDAKITGSGNKAEIVEDGGSKALKITYTGSGAVELFNYFTENHSYQMGDKLVRAGFKVRLESFTEAANITEFNKMYNQTRGTQIGMLVCGRGKEVWINQYDPAMGMRVESDMTEYRDKYFSVASTYNRTSKLGTVEAPDGTYTWQGANDYPFQAAEFTVTTANGNYKGFDSATDESGNKVNTVIYIDDIFFERISYEVLGVYVQDTIQQGTGLTDVPLNAPINVKLSDAYDKDTIKDYLSLTDSTGAAVDFTVAFDADNSVTVFPEGQKIGETYTFNAASGIKSAINPSVATSAAETVTYTTCEDGFSFMGYIDNLSFDDLEDSSYSRAGSGDFLDGKIYVHGNTEGDSIAVTTDPVTGSKALKLTRKLENLYAGLSKYNYVFDKAYDTGRIVVKFDTRMANDNGGTTSFMSFSDDSGTGTSPYWQGAIYNGYWWATSQGSGQQWANGMQHWTNDRYFPAVMNIDFRTNKFSGVVLRDLTNFYNAKEWTFPNTPETLTANVKYMNLVDFRSSNVTAGATKDSEIYIDNLKVSYYDFKTLGVNSVSKPQAGADISGEIVIKMNDVVIDADVTKDNFVIMDTDGNEIPGYTVKKDGVNIILTVPNGLSYETPYIVAVKAGISSETTGVKATDSIYTYAFMTGAYNQYIFEDNFEGMELGTKWEGPATVNIGNVTVDLEAGDSIEYATDSETGKNGFKLTKGSGTGNLNFKYIFPEGYKDGKYRVYVDSRIENWSKAHNVWPGLLNEEAYIAYGRANRITGSYWLQQSGNYKGVDRYGYDWSAVNDGRWICGYSQNKNYKVMGELTTGAGYTYGLYDPETGETSFSRIEEATTGTTLGGVLMRMNGSQTDWSAGIYQGTQNPGEDGISWIYGVAVEKVMIDVTDTSFVPGSDTFNPAEEEISVGFSLRVDPETVNSDTVKLYKEGELVKDVTVEVGADNKSVVISPAEGVMYKTNYSVTVDGVWCYDHVAGKVTLKNYSFKTVRPEDFQLDEVEAIAGGIVSALYNNTEKSSSYIVIGVGKDSEGNITEIKTGSKGTIDAESSLDVSVEMNSAASYEMYVWEDLAGVKPLVKKK